MQNITVKVESNLKYEINSYLASISQRLQFLNIKHNLVKLPAKKIIFTFLRSPHVHKKSKDQYAIHMHKACIKIELSQGNLDFVEQNFVSNKPFGVKLTIICKK